MTEVLVWVEWRGEHLDDASILALVIVLAHLGLVATLMHAEPAPADRAAFGVLEVDLDSKLQSMSRLKRNKISHGCSGGRGSRCKSAGCLGESGNLCGSSCLPPLVCSQSATDFLILWITSETNFGHRQLLIVNLRNYEACLKHFVHPDKKCW